MLPPILMGMRSLVSGIQLHLHFCMPSALYMLHRYDLLNCTFLYIDFNLHILLTLETLPKSDNYCLVGFIFRNQLIFVTAIAILKLVKRYSFNPLYNPYILIIYTPLNEKRPSRWSFFIYDHLLFLPFIYFLCHQLRTVLTRKPASRNMIIYGASMTNAWNTTERTRSTTTATMQVISQPGILTRLSSPFSALPAV